MKTSPAFEAAKRAGAKFIDFAGWRMPFSYSSPRGEHLACRRGAAVFDVSHMGEIRIRGKNSLAFLQSLVPTDAGGLSAGQAQYSVLCNAAGGLIDDLLIYAIAAGEDYMLCVNAAFREKDWLWIKFQSRGWSGLEITDESALWGMIAVQGPKSFELLKAVFPSVAFDEIGRFHFALEKGMIFARAGYTGEKGFEIFIPWREAAAAWDRLLKEGGEPAGLGARDTLRLEMGYLLAGQDFDETKTPWQAGLGRLLKNPKPDIYIGKEALLKQPLPQGGGGERLRGFVLKAPSSEKSLDSEKFSAPGAAAAGQSSPFAGASASPPAVPRTGSAVFSTEGERIGAVTSGARSPSLESMIGLAYIKGQRDSFFVDIRGQKAEAYVAAPPFLPACKEKKP